MNAVQLLQQLISIPSVSGNEGEAVNYLVSAMKDLGYEAEIDQAGNAVGIRQKRNIEGEITKELLLLGHIDTVPGKIEVRIKDNLLYGRGSVDAKGPLSAFVAAGAQAELQPGMKIVVVGAVEEESATSKGARHIAQQYNPDYCIVGEPSGWDGVTLGYKGRLLIDYVKEEDMGHTAGKERDVGQKAILWWNKLSSLIADYNKSRERFFDQLLPSIRHIETSSDGLVNRIEMKVGVRLPPDFNIDSFQEKVYKLAPGAQLKMYAYEPAFQSSRLTPLARSFNKVFRRAGIRPRFKLKTGTSDMNVVGPVWQIPILAYGPGDSALDHTPNEHIDLAEYEKGIAILIAVIDELGQTDAG